MKKLNTQNLIIIFLMVFVLLLGICAVSASENSTQNDTVSVVKTKVSTPDLGYVYKKNSKMHITVKEKSTKQPVKNLKIKVKVYTNKKSKTYNLKTNSKGVAKLSTKKLKLGTHTFIVKSRDGNFSVYKKDKIFIGYKKSVTLKVNKHKKLKSGDVISTNIQNKTGTATHVWYGGMKSDIDPHYTMILKAKLYFKDKTGKIKTKTVKGKLFTYNGEVYRGLPSTTPIKGYTPYKAKVWFLTSV